MAQSFRALYEAMGEKIGETQQALVLHAARVVKGQGMVRVPPKGQPADSVESLAWVPHKWRQGAYLPEALRDHGAPWLMVGKPGTLRDACAGWPFPGFGHMLSVVTGQVLLMSWPIRAVTDLGPAPEDGWEFLCALPYSNFAKFATTHITHAVLSPGSCAWVPFGRVTCTLTLYVEGQHSTIVYAPWINGKIAAMCPDKHAWCTWSVGSLTAQVANGTKPWTHLRAGLSSWLRSVDPDLAGHSAADAADTRVGPATDAQSHDLN